MIIPNGGPLRAEAPRDRVAALRQLVLQTPAPVVAKALGYHDHKTTGVLAEVGGTWNGYTARGTSPTEGDS